MMILLLIALGCALIYLALQAFYLWHWHAIPLIPHAESPASLPGVSILVVARNEENSIANTLTGLLQQEYPSGAYDIILIDDHSDDRTLAIGRSMTTDRLVLLSLRDFPEYIKSPAYKKSAITLGVAQSRFDHIVVTDADCLHDTSWLMSVMKAFTSNAAVFQTSPVLLRSGTSLIEKMQEMEQLVLMLITGAGIQSGWHDLANGANMAFTKSAFSHVQGYESNMHLASGDDMFLVEKIRMAYPDGIRFAKTPDAVVYTDAKPNWSSLTKQRLRWAGKNKGLRNKRIARIWAFVGFYHVFMVITLILGVLNLMAIGPGLVMLAVKWMADVAIIYTSASFFHRKNLLLYYIPLQVVYTYYVLRMGWMMLMQKEGDWQR